MRSLTIFFIIFILNTGQSQEELLNQCFVLTIDTKSKTDLRLATFDLPFAAMRESQNNEKIVIPHYFFDLQVDDQANTGMNVGLNITGIRPYVYGETLLENEIAFFAMEWPEESRPEGTGPILASFPSMNNEVVKTDHIIIQERLTLSNLLVEQLSLKKSFLEKGIYRLYRQDVTY